jgi:hypothetical protein
MESGPVFGNRNLNSDTICDVGRVGVAMGKLTGEEPIREYLLGGLDEEERSRVEARYVADEEAFEELLAVENDLIDGYIAGRLTPDERGRFEAAYLTSAERRQRVEFARALSRACALAEQPVAAPRRPFWEVVAGALPVRPAAPQWSLAAVAAAVLIGGSWLAVENRRLSANLEKAQAGQAALERSEEALRQQIAGLEASKKPAVPAGAEVAQLETPGPEAIFQVTPGTGRGDGESQAILKLSPTASDVQLRLMVDGDEYKTYEAILQPVGGHEALWGDGLQSRTIRGSKMIVWHIPARSLGPGDYIVRLSGRVDGGGMEEIDSYAFRVVRK